MNIFFVHENMKKPPSKVEYLAKLKKLSLTGLTAQTAQKLKFVFSNVSYRATVHKTGVYTRSKNFFIVIFVLSS